MSKRREHIQKNGTTSRMNHEAHATSLEDCVTQTMLEVATASLGLEPVGVVSIGGEERTVFAVGDQTLRLEPAPSEVGTLDVDVEDDRTDLVMFASREGECSVHFHGWMSRAECRAVGQGGSSSIQATDLHPAELLLESRDRRADDGAVERMMQMLDAVWDKSVPTPAAPEDLAPLTASELSRLTRVGHIGMTIHQLDNQFGDDLDAKRLWILDPSRRRDWDAVGMSDVPDQLLEELTTGQIASLQAAADPRLVRASVLPLGATRREAEVMTAYAAAIIGWLGQHLPDEQELPEPWFNNNVPKIVNAAFRGAFRGAVDEIPSMRRMRRSARAAWN